MFGTSGIRGEVGEAVTADLALAVGRAVASEGAARVVVGRDPRESGRLLSDAVATGARECGADVVRLGLAATPTVARAVAWEDADAGVAVTASHNPPEDNGLKLWTPSGRAFDAEQRAAITRRVREEAFDLAAWDGLGSTERADAASRHAAVLRADAGDVADLTVAVDVGCGAGQVTLEALGALDCTVRALNAQPDGSFPARPSEPTAENCEALCAFVASTDADLGVAHDGDADRLRAVAEDGTFLSGDALLALFARAAAEPGERVAVPVDTSLAVDDALAEVDVEVTRTPVGDVHVAAAAAAEGVAFGGEPSGAWIWPDRTLCPDGPQAAVRLAELVSERGPLSEQVAALPAYPIRRDDVEVANKESTMDAVADLVAERYDDVSSVDGVRVDLGDAWFLVRASGTQPLVRVTAEARDSDRADAVLLEARDIVSDAVDA